MGILTLKVAYIGATWDGGVDSKNDLLLRIIEKVSGCQICVVNDVREAEIVLAYPYVVGSWGFRFKWLVAHFLRKLGLVKDYSRLFRKMLGVGDKPVIFVSHENLDKPYWWNLLGRFLVESNIPRLTFWPHEIDPHGARFPYWYNYVDWPEYPREEFYQRFGRLYKIDELLSPLSPQDGRKNAAVSISSHLDHPRQALLQFVRGKLLVEAWGGAGARFSGGKLDLMQQYKFAFCPENSTGYGYDTEKIPEAWAAGCIPVGIYLNPYSDFNPSILECSLASGDAVYRAPLLLKTPNLRAVEDYVRQFLGKYLSGYAHLQRDITLSGSAGID